MRASVFAALLGVLERNSIAFALCGSPRGWPCGVAKKTKNAMAKAPKNAAKPAR